MTKQEALFLAIGCVDEVQLAESEGIKRIPSVQKEEVKMLQKKNISANKRVRRPRLLLIAALVALMLLLMGAAVFTRWPQTSQTRYKPSQEVKEQAAQSGLSVLLDDKNTQTDDVLSATDQGITVTAVQTLVDNYRAWITFRIEGFELPAGRAPWTWFTMDIGGEEYYYSCQSFSFFDGTTRDEENRRVYAKTGEPVKFDETGSVILDYVKEDGSLELTVSLTFLETDGRYFGKNLHIHFTGFCLDSQEKAGDPEDLVKGSWDLHWTLTGADTEENAIKRQPNVRIGDTKATLTKLELSQLSLRTEFRLDEYWEGFNALETFYAEPQGVKMKDGSIIRMTPFRAGYLSEEEWIYYVECTMYDGIVDLSKAETILFHKGWEQDENGKLVEEYIEIPIE